MIQTRELEKTVSRYRQNCRYRHIEPSYIGLGRCLGCSGTTISNVIHGKFNGHSYTERPHSTRCIDNNDFELIRELFDFKTDNVTLKQ